MATKKKQKKGGKKGRPDTSLRKNWAKEYRERVRKTKMSKIVDLSKDDTIIDIRGRVSTQSLVLDRLLRSELPDGTFEKQGGIPLGRVTEIYGPPYIGKSTMLDHILCSVQRAGGEAVLFDTEVARDKTYMQHLGVDLKKLHYHEFEEGTTLTIEKVMELAIDAIKFWKQADVPVVIGFDALGGTSTEDEYDKPLYGKKKPKPGGAAKIMHQAARQLPKLLQKTKIALVILNHEYQTFQMSRSGYRKKASYGGSGTPHVASLRLHLIPCGSIIDEKTGWPLGHKIIVEIKKNRLGVARKVEISVLQGRGIDNIHPLYTDLCAAKVMHQNGSWIQLNVDGKKYNFQGYKQYEDAVVTEPEFYNLLVGLYQEHVVGLGGMT